MAGAFSRSWECDKVSHCGTSSVTATGETGGQIAWMVARLIGKFMSSLRSRFKKTSHLSVLKLHEMECRGSWGMHPAVPSHGDDMIRHDET